MFKLSFFIAIFKSLDNDLFEAFSIAKVKAIERNNKSAKFINGKIDIAIELIANKSYLDVILEESSYSSPNLSFFYIDSSSKTNSDLVLLAQTLRQT